MVAVYSKPTTLYRMTRLRSIRGVVGYALDASEQGLKVWGVFDQRVADVESLGEVGGGFLAHGHAGIKNHADYEKAAIAVFLLKLFVSGHLAFAGLAPRRLLIEEQDFAFQVLRREPLAVNVSEVEFGDASAEFAGPIFCGGLAVGEGFVVRCVSDRSDERRKSSQHHRDSEQ